jgi:hypothetical protein
MPGIFSADMITEHKREVRKIIWSAAARHAKYYGPGAPVMLLPGETDEEIEEVRSHLDRPKIFAYDTRQVAVQAARDAGVFKAERRDVLSLPPKERYVVANYDDCKVIGEPFIQRLRAVEARTLSVLGVSMTVGHSKVPPGLPTRRIPELETDRWDDTWRRRAETLAGLLGVNWNPCVLIKYQGYGTPILTTLWCRPKVRAQTVSLLKGGMRD